MRGVWNSVVACRGRAGESGTHYWHVTPAVPRHSTATFRQWVIECAESSCVKPHSCWIWLASLYFIVINLLISFIKEKSVGNFWYDIYSLIGWWCCQLSLHWSSIQFLFGRYFLSVNLLKIINKSLIQL